MILIDKEQVRLDEIAEKHWKYFKDKIGYKTPPLGNKIPSNNDEIIAKKNELLKDIIGVELYDHLEDIIKGDIDYLIKIAKENQHLCYFPRSKKKIEKRHKRYTRKKRQLKNILEGLKKRKGRFSSVADFRKKEKEFAEIKHSYEKYVKIAQRIEALIDTQNKKILKKFNKATQRSYTFIKGDEKETKIVSLYDLLGYDNFYDGKDWNSSLLCKALDVEICPYCNRQYIYTVEKKDDSLLTTAQLDHFLPKDNYPLFSFSFYNLIPSCYCCNHTKGNNLKRTIYPYKEAFDEDGKFVLTDLKSGGKITDLKPSDNLGVEIVANGAQKGKILASDEVFQLTPLYNKHQNEIGDVVERYKHFSGIKKNECINLSLISSNKEARDIILGRPLVLKREIYLLKKLKDDLFDCLQKARNRGQI